ncbi:MAG: hypothetical protein H6581_08740 [Bacteroidia bacterium]|nr:hypothetical protein [Bacteroidia bacterium]
MKKNFTKLSLLALALLLMIAPAVNGQAHETPKAVTVEGDMAPLPAFAFANLDGTQLTPEALPQNMPVIFFYFDPDCEHCQQEAKWVAEAIGPGEKGDKFTGISLVWVSWGEMDAIQNFKDTFFAGVKHDNLIFCKDTEYMIDEYFGYSEVPSIYVYNNKWLRTASFKNETHPTILIPKAWK